MIWDKVVGRKQPMITVFSAGKFRLNLSAVEEFGNPRAVAVYWDSEAGKAGLGAVSKGVEGARSLSGPKNDRRGSLPVEVRKVVQPGQYELVLDGSASVWQLVRVEAVG